MASAQSIRAGKAFVELSVKADNLTAKIQTSLNSLSTKLESFSKSASQKLADAFVVAAPVGFATKIFADFDDQMRVVQAVSGATGQAFEKLTEQAKELGRTTSFTASQVAEGMAGLGRAGFNSSEIEKSIAAVMALSRATSTDLALATDIAGNTLRAFNLDAAEMGRVCDVLTATANGSAQTVEDLGEALKFVAPIAAQTGMSVEDTAKVLGTLANFGIKGSNAGTAFKNMRTRMADSSVQAVYQSIGVETVDKDTGALRELSAVLKDVGLAVQNMPDAQRLDIFKELFGMYGLAGGAVMTTAEGFDALYAAIDNAAGVAERTQETMETGLGGAIRSTLSACEGLAIALGDAITPALLEIGDSIKSATAKFTTWIATNKTFFTWITKTSAKLLAFGAATVVVATVTSKLVGAAKLAIAGFRAFGAALGWLTGVTKALAAAEAAKNAVSVATKSVEGAKLAMTQATTAAEVAAAQASLNAAMADQAQALAAQKATAALAMQKLALAGVIGVAAGLAAVAAGIAYVTATAEKGASKAKEYRTAIEGQASANEGLRQKDAELFQELQNLAEQGELTNEEFARGKSIIDQLTSRYGDLGISIDDVAKKFGLAADSKAKFDAAIRGAQKKDLEAQIQALQNENAEIDKAMKKYTGDGFSSIAVNYGRKVGSFFGADTAEERVESLGNDKLANMKQLASLRQQLDALNEVDEAAKKDAEEQAEGKVSVVDTRVANQTSAEFEKKRAEEGVGKYEAQRAPIEKEFTEYLDAQKKILEAALQKATTDEERQKAQETYDSNVATATEWRDSKIGVINAQEQRDVTASQRTSDLALAQSRLYTAQTAHRLNPTDESKKELDDAAASLKEVEKINAESHAEEAFARLDAAAQALKDAQTAGNASQIEAAQIELANAQQEASSASQALDDLVKESVPETSSTGTFDAFEAFDMTNDWEKEAMEQQTECLETISETLLAVRKNLEDGTKDENGVVVI